MASSSSDPEDSESETSAEVGVSDKIDDAAVEAARRSIEQSDESVSKEVPSKWKGCNDWSRVRIECDQLTARYLGKGNYEQDFGLVFADAPVYLRGEGYYFEITVLDVGESKQVHIGLTRTEPGTMDQLGMSRNSFAYFPKASAFRHNRGGGNFMHSGLANGDVLGFGINCISGHVFATKNGTVVFEEPLHPLALTFIGTPFYPAASMNSEGEAICANFGQDSFAFKINRYFKKSGEARAKAIRSTPLETEQIMPLIREHLCYHGFADTLRSLDSCIGENAETEEKYPVAHFVQTSMLNIRQEIKRSILAGMPLAALKQLEEHFPDVVPKVRFSLENQEVAERLKKGDMKGALIQAKANSKDVLRPTNETKHESETLVKLVSVVVRPDAEIANFLLSPQRRVELAEKVNHSIIENLYTDAKDKSFLDTYCERLERYRKRDHRSLFATDSEATVEEAVEMEWRNLGL